MWTFPRLSAQSDNCSFPYVSHRRWPRPKGSYGCTGLPYLPVSFTALPSSTWGDVIFISKPLCARTHPDWHARPNTQTDKPRSWIGSRLDAFRGWMLRHAWNVGERCTCQVEEHPRQGFTWRSVKSQKTFTTSPKVREENERERKRESFPRLIWHRNFLVVSEPGQTHSTRENHLVPFSSRFRFFVDGLLPGCVFICVGSCW